MYQRIEAADGAAADLGGSISTERIAVFHAPELERSPACRERCIKSYENK